MYERSGMATDKKTTSLLVVGNVTYKQYDRIRLTALNQNTRLRIIRVTPEEWNVTQQFSVLTTEAVKNLSGLPQLSDDPNDEPTDGAINRYIEAVREGLQGKTASLLGVDIPLDFAYTQTVMRLGSFDGATEDDSYVDESEVDSIQKRVCEQLQPFGAILHHTIWDGVTSSAGWAYCLPYIYVVHDSGWVETVQVPATDEV
jgi:hypothetical protein